MDPARFLDSTPVDNWTLKIRDGREALRDGLRDQNLGQFGFIALMAATLFVTMTAAGKNVLSFDVSIAQALQRSGFPGLAEMSIFVSVAGGTTVMLVVATVVLVWLARSGHYAAMVPVVAAIALRAGNAVIKTTAESPRPTAEFVQKMETPAGFGFPSAHVMGVVLLYGVIGILAHELIRSRSARLVVQAVAVGMILIVGPGRVYTGAHWPTDVLGAYLFGILFLIPMIVGYRTLRDTLPERVSLPRPVSVLRFAGLPVTRKETTVSRRSA